MNEAKLKRIFLVGAVAVTSLILLWMAGEYIFVCLLPFAIACAVSLAVKPAASFISRKFGVGKRFVSVFIVIVMIGAIFLFLSWLVGILVSEVQSAASSLEKSLSEEDNVLKKVVDYFSSMKGRLPFIPTEGNVGDSLYSALSGVITDALSKAASAVAGAATSVISVLPRFILALVTTVISTFYICTDNGKISSELETFVGKRAIDGARRATRKVKRAMTSYIKSYLILMMITFAELLIGFTVLGVENSLLLSLIIALIDLLPVLGSASVLIPWALVRLIIVGDTKLGVGLLVMVALMYLVRQFAEPHIVGTMVGVHPILSLGAVYVGFVLFGFAGVVFLPLLVYFIKVLLADGEKENSSAPV